MIISAQHNTPLEDLATANNYARPIIAGGTGSNNAADAATSLKVVSYLAQSLTTAEKAQAQANIEPEVIVKTADYTVVVNDRGSIIDVDASAAARTITLPAAATAGNGFPITVKKSDATGNAVTIEADSSETIDGSLTRRLSTQYQSISLVCDGTGWRVIGEAGSITVSALASATGSAVDFMGIPAGVKRITVFVADVSTAGANTPLLQLGDSGGVETTGYNSINSLIVNGGPSVVATSTTGFAFGAGNASNTYIGVLVLNLINPATNLWGCSGTVGAPSVFSAMSGYKATSAVLDRVRLTVGGGDTYDAGTFFLSWEF